ncbi:Ig-like domain-containing protein [Vibrio sp. 10N.261.46.A3]|uniref:Ig-like domain-containing protein n=1 Tax=Vibrio sp. 10N.261.46.A3 TaxID=3229658 RepID=UPI00354F1890
MMNKFFIPLLLIVIFSLLTGCNSEGAFTSSAVNRVITDITVTPPKLQGGVGQSTQLTATATYSDGTSSDVTKHVVWASDPSVAVVDPEGVVLGVGMGTTTLTATKDSVSCNTVDVEVTSAVITDIAVTPPKLQGGVGQSTQLTATATYSDGTSSDVTRYVVWASDPSVAVVDPEGGVLGVGIGATTLAAMKDSVSSNTVDVEVCSDLSGVCIDFFDVGGGKLFTSNPSVNYLDSIGIKSGTTTFTEYGAWGPAGDYYQFDFVDASALCASYSAHNLGGRANWKLPTKDELQAELLGIAGNMFDHGWPTGFSYLSLTEGSAGYYSVGLQVGGEFVLDKLAPAYVACVSEVLP